MFKPASRHQVKLRLALCGPSGSGKTYTALAVAKALLPSNSKREGNALAVIDTESGSANRYAGDVADFDCCELPTGDPRAYIQAIQEAGDAGYPVLIIDSLSHAWAGVDGALEMVDKAAKRTQSGSTFNAWRDVSPLHNRLVDALLRYPGHLIVTMRTKTEYVLEPVTNKRGQTVMQPRKVGLAPVQRAGMDYEFDVVIDMDLEHHGIVGKTRCSAIDGEVFDRPGADLAKRLTDWLHTGERVKEPGEGDPAFIAILAQLQYLQDLYNLRRWWDAQAPYRATYPDRTPIMVRALRTRCRDLGLDPSRLNSDEAKHPPPVEHNPEQDDIDAFAPHEDDSQLGFADDDAEADHVH